MPNSLTTKFAVMEQKLVDIEKSNSSEHREIIKKVNDIGRKLECFVTQKDLDLVKSDVKDNRVEIEKIKTRVLMAAGAIAVIIWILNHYNIKFFI